MRERLDKVIEAKKALIVAIDEFQRESEKDEITVCTTYENSHLHIYSGIEKIADALGCETETANRKSEDYPTQIQFTYGDILFYELKNK